MYTHIYMYIYVHTYMCIYIYRERERERKGERERERESFFFISHLLGMFSILKLLEAESIVGGLSLKLKLY